MSGIAVDWIGKNIYWGSTQANEIYVSKLDGRYTKHLLREISDLGFPRELAVDPREGYLFWAQYGLIGFIGKDDGLMAYQFVFAIILTINVIHLFAFNLFLVVKTLKMCIWKI